MKSTIRKKKPSCKAFTFRDLPTVSLLRLIFIFLRHTQGDYRTKARILGVSPDRFEQLMDCYNRRLKRMTSRTRLR